MNHPTGSRRVWAERVPVLGAIISGREGLDRRETDTACFCCCREYPDPCVAVVQQAKIQAFCARFGLALDADFAHAFSSYEQCFGAGGSAVMLGFNCGQSRISSWQLPLNLCCGQGPERPLQNQIAE